MSNAGVLETTQSLVRIPSVNAGYDATSPSERDVAAWVVDWAKAHEFDVEVQEVFPERPNVIIRFRNGADHPHLLLNGHTDTVAITEMTIPPFEAEVRDGRVWGRGTADMKGPVACMLHALLSLREEAAEWRGTVTVALVVDEELGFQGIRDLLKRGESYDFAIVGEPTRFEVVRGCKGCLRFWVRAHGQAAHSSTPEKGRSSISAIARAVVAMEGYFQDRLAKTTHPDFDRSTGSVGLIRGGSGINIVPDFCEVSVDIRLLPGQSGEETYQEIQRLVEAVTDTVRWEFDPQPLIDTPFCREEADDFVQQVCRASNREQASVVNFSCDASKIAKAGIPCLIFGPGDIAQAHTANESIPIEELDLGVEAYVSIARELLKL